MLMGTPQQGQDAGAQLAARHGVERCVNGLVRQTHRFFHTTECERNLLWTQALAEMLNH